jgi:predicted DNA-binding protein (MmcQ/YjbR family)
MGTMDRTRSSGELKMIERMRRITEPLDGVEVGIDGFGHTTFKAGKKSFVLIGAGHDGGGGSMAIKSDPITQAALIRRGPYTRTPYIGQHGWVSVDAGDRIDWEDIAEIVRDAYGMVAPKRRGTPATATRPTATDMTATKKTATKRTATKKTASTATQKTAIHTGAKGTTSKGTTSRRKTAKSPAAGKGAAKKSGVKKSSGKSSGREAR